MGFTGIFQVLKRTANNPGQVNELKRVREEIGRDIEALIPQIEKQLFLTGSPEFFARYTTGTALISAAPSSLPDPVPYRTASGSLILQNYEATVPVEAAPRRVIPKRPRARRRFYGAN